GLLAPPRKSALDGPADYVREDRLPWLMPANYTAPETQEGAAGKMRDALMRIDRELRMRVEDRLRGWLSATAFQRLAEQYKDPVQLECEVQRLVAGAAQLPALEPPHVRPQGFPPEYELVFFADAKSDELPSTLRMVVDTANRERPTQIVPSRSSHFLTAIAEHQGFALSRCPVYYHLQDGTADWLKLQPAGTPIPYNRLDVPWSSATLISRAALRDASDVYYLSLAWGVLHPNPDGAVPIPGSLIPAEPGERRFALPAEFDLAVRQLAGDLRLLDGLAKVVDRTFQSKGVEWCGLQLERAVRGDAPLGTRFPGTDVLRQARVERLAAQRAAARYEDLYSEFARTPSARDTEWLRDGDSYHCPLCALDLGTDVSALPGACPRCREPLLLHLVRDLGPTDGFRRIPNPFVVGTPLETRSNVFVGREDIIAQVHDRLIRPAQRTILILIGERRCGKTSALKQLQYRLEGDLTPLFIDMQGLTATDLPGFLWWLSWRMKEALDERGIHMELPSFEEFTSGPADYQFETVVLQEVRRKLSGGRVLLMLDEFEVLAQRVMAGTFDARAFDYIRHLMQHGEGIEFLFAGTHVLRQFAANYVTFLFNIGVFLNVDFLRPEDALRLIQEPLAHASVTFSDEALEAVLELAGAHAYFTQMFGFHLVERLNRLRKRNVTREDVQAESGPVIAAGGAHLDHLWGQLTAPDRLLISFFAEFCGRGERCREEDLLQAAIRDDATLRPFVFRTAVEKLIAVGLLRGAEVESPEGRPERVLSLTAEVYRQWLQTAHPYRRLRDEGVAWG
ncbi:MAG: AAA family ATPase, partial [Actinomycetota bacterium]